MAEVVVVGAGLAGLAAAARLAKLGHRVVLCERNDSAGGAMRAIEHEGFGWDAGPTSTALPAVLRDLFRKSGRPLEHYADLVPCDPIRRYVFEDGSFVDLPGGSRSGQAAAVSAGIGAAAAQAWTSYVDRLADVWDVLRRHVLDPPDGGSALGNREIARALNGRVSLATLVEQTLPDPQLRLMAVYPFLLAGSQPRDVPSFGAVAAYVERSFGVWAPAAGWAAVTEALVARMAERRVDLRLGTEVASIGAAEGGVEAVTTSSGTTIPADVVVSAVDLTTLLRLLGPSAPARLRSVVERSTPARPASVTHLGLVDDGLPVLPHEIALLGDPLLVLHTRGRAPGGRRAWTLWRRGPGAEDSVDALARRGIDVRGKIVTRVERSADDVIAESAGSPWGFAWGGWRSEVRRAALVEPLPGLHLLGASTFPGASVPYVAWGAAAVAARLGKA